ncbi:MAG: hypothetical protein HY835_10200 [Anaerolineae bacterium]|nr:hypothetical protein [Anaerolineae bacterium]
MKKLVFLILLFLLTACSSGTAVTPQPVDTPTVEVSPTPQATLTPTSLPARALLFAPAGTPDSLQQDALALVQELAVPAGLTVESTTDLQAGALTGEVKLVVALARPANLDELLAAAPQAQFVVISTDALEPAANLSVLQPQAEHQAFIAGLVATLVSDDWRSAGLIPSSSPNLQNAFANGGRYFCGMCRPGWPLAVEFPLAGGPAAPGDGPAWTAVANDFMENGKVDSVYLSAEASLPDMYTYFNGRTQLQTVVRLVGVTPPPVELQTQWIATVGFDLVAGLREAMPQALAGQSAGKIVVPVQLSNINPDLLSTGRLEQVNLALADLQAGLINPITPPLE